MSPKNLQNPQGHECYDQCFLLTGGIPELFGDGTECREIVAGATVYSCKHLLRLRLMYCLSHLSLYPQSLITVAFDYCAQLCGYTFLYIGKQVETYWYSQTCISHFLCECVSHQLYPCKTGMQTAGVATFGSFYGGDSDNIHTRNRDPSF